MRSLVLATVLVGLAACSTSTQAPARSPSLTSATPVPGCALGVAGASATTVDTPDGIALTVVSLGKTDEIRVRARDAASMYGPDARKGLGHEGHHLEGGKHGLQPMQLPPSRAMATDVEGGARIEIVPAVASDLEAVRAKVRERAEAMNRACD